MYIHLVNLLKIYIVKQHYVLKDMVMNQKLLDINI